MRHVGGKVAEEGAVLVGANEFERLVEPHVGAVALELLGLAVAEVGVVEVVVSPVIGAVADGAAAVVEGLLESPVLGPEGITVAQVPLAEHAGPIAIGREDVGHGRLAGAEQRSP